MVGSSKIPNRLRESRRAWTPEENQALAAHRSPREAMRDPKLASRTAKAIALQWDRMRLEASRRPAESAPESPAEPAETVVGFPPLPPDTLVSSTFEEDRQRTSDNLLQEQHEQLQRRYAKALKELSVVDRLVEDIRSLAPKSYSPAPPVPPVVHHKGRPQSAVVQVSDSHVGLVVKPEQTLGFGGYNWQIFLNRLGYLEEHVIAILRDHVNTGIDRLVVAFGGDMIHGNLQHAAEADQRNTLVAQWMNASHAFAQFLRNLAAHVPVLEVRSVVGNHPRWANQRKMPTVNRNSNLDMFLYGMVQALVSAIGNIEFPLDMQPFAQFSVYDFQFLLAHGDHWRGGDRALGIPAHAIGRELSARSQLFAKAGQPPINYILTGHLHREISIPHANGAVLINGGFPGIDNYGLAENFAPIDPSQRFFLVHPVYGITANYSLALKFATDDEGARYTIPTSVRVPIE